MLDIRFFAVRKHFSDTAEQTAALSISYELRLESSFAAFFNTQGVPKIFVDCQLVVNILSLATEVGRYGRRLLVDK